MGFSRQEYWSGWSFALLGDLSDPGNEPGSPVLAGRFFNTEPLRKPTWIFIAALFTNVKSWKQSQCNWVVVVQSLSHVQLFGISGASVHGIF